MTTLLHPLLPTHSLRPSPAAPLLRWLLAAFSGAAVGLPASAQTVVINDLTEDPITAVVSDSLNPGDNGTITADKATPEKVTFSISVDGRGGGSGVAVMLEPDKTTVSDLLEVSVTQKFRGQFMNIPYLSITGTFTSDGDPKGLDLSNLGLTEAIMKKVLETALIEDGTYQDVGARLVDTGTGNALGIGGLKITAASEVPEPSSILVCSGLVAAWGVARRIRRRCGSTRRALGAFSGPV